MTNTFSIKNINFGEGRCKICVPIVGNTAEDILREANEIRQASSETTVDVVEFRGDFFEGLNDKNALKNILVSLQDIFSDTILLFTIRSEKEGGEKLSFDTPSISEINNFVIENKLADMVDVELFSGDDVVLSTIELAKNNGVKIIMSNHDFDKTPSLDVIVERLCKMQQLGTDVAKIAVMPQSEKDVLTLLEATSRMKNEYAKVPIVTMSMGRLGAISRISGDIFGSAMTFATVKKASAPGQLPISVVDDMLNCLK